MGTVLEAEALQSRVHQDPGRTLSTVVPEPSLPSLSCLSLSWHCSQHLQAFPSPPGSRRKVSVECSLCSNFQGFACWGQWQEMGEKKDTGYLAPDSPYRVCSRLSHPFPHLCSPSPCLLSPSFSLSPLPLSFLHVQ